VFELLAVNDEIRITFLDNNNASVIRKVAHSTGNYLSLREAGFIKALQGETTLDEAMNLLSYNEKETFYAMDLKTEEIKYWMEEE
jgi:type II secretory ATPase GspE/PulE/Tfp pilus assembly ATPase PilB-like protein